MTIDITQPCSPAKALSPRALGEHESDDLWALTRIQRQQAMWNGALTLFQLREWTGRAPTEIPTPRARIRLDRDANPRMGRDRRHRHHPTPHSHP